MPKVFRRRHELENRANGKIMECTPYRDFGCEIPLRTEMSGTRRYAQDYGCAEKENGA